MAVTVADAPVDVAGRQILLVDGLCGTLARMLPAGKVDVRVCRNKLKKHPKTACILSSSPKRVEVRRRRRRLLAARD